ncbi:hypothetical protein [Emticicia agri]|uniref:DUF2306 domain-containing protein n=1 Tax=Emticicia agri TaxID=2492393 RepID=A0A4Q5LY52_9BACT|nr:hypothetical protein [Emticicia agri]RYU94704.1 hypothetical protein EWM59_15335 [Emticicia agri]
MEKLIFNFFLVIHVICGFLSLSTGLIAMMAQKGKKAHNISGIIFYWAMVGVFVTTVIFFIIYPTQLKYQFFLTIGVISFYPTFSGKRLLQMKKAIVPTLIDWLAAWGVGICGIVMIGYSVYGFMNPVGFNGMAILFAIFGVVCLVNAYGDLKIYLGYQKPEKMHWFLGHGGKMMGAYSAALTAFFVNIVPRYMPKNTPDFVFILTWVLPGVIVGVIAARILKKYKAKFAVKSSKPVLQV